MSKFGDLKSRSIEELESISEQIREKILETVSRNGGHLSSTLGATDIIVAMHRVLIQRLTHLYFDVSHKLYAHKLLMDRIGDSFWITPLGEGLGGNFGGILPSPG